MSKDPRSPDDSKSSRVRAVQRWSLTIEAERDGAVPPSWRPGFWLMLALALGGIAATVAYGTGWLP